MDGIGKGRGHEVYAVEQYKLVVTAAAIWDPQAELTVICIQVMRMPSEEHIVCETYGLVPPQLYLLV